MPADPYQLFDRAGNLNRRELERLAANFYAMSRPEIGAGARGYTSIIGHSSQPDPRLEMWIQITGKDNSSPPKYQFVEARQTGPGQWQPLGPSGGTGLDSSDGYQDTTGVLPAMESSGNPNVPTDGSVFVRAQLADSGDHFVFSYQGGSTTPGGGQAAARLAAGDHAWEGRQQNIGDIQNNPVVFDIIEFDTGGFGYAPPVPWLGVGQYIALRATQTGIYHIGASVGVRTIDASPLPSGVWWAQLNVNFYKGFGIPEIAYTQDNLDDSNTLAFLSVSTIYHLLGPGDPHGDPIGDYVTLHVAEPIGYAGATLQIPGLRFFTPSLWMYRVG